MKLAALAVSLLVAVIATVGSLLSQTSRSSVASDILVLELSQKTQDQDAKLSKTEEALRQLQGNTSGLVPTPSEGARHLSRVGNLQIQMQQIDSEDHRLGVLRDQLVKEQERLDVWQKESDLSKHRLDQDEKVLGLEVMAKALDDRQLTKPPLPQLTAVVAPKAPKLAVDLHGETPFEFAQAMVPAVPDYASLQDRHTQLQTERKQWALDKQALLQAKSQLKSQLAKYNHEFRQATRNREKLEAEVRALKKQGIALRAKS
jgi:DNA repair exonuclease SbcCD ATPase subunit